MVHRFEQELSRFNLKGGTWQYAVTSYFLSESAIKAQRQGHRKIRSRRKVFLKFPTHPHQLSVNNKKFCSFFCCCYFIFQIESFLLSETYRHGWRKAKIATQSIHIMLCYFNEFVYRLSFCSHGQHFDIFMDNVDMQGLSEHYGLLEYYNGYVYIFRACHWRLPAAYYLQAVAVQFVQFAKQNNQWKLIVYYLSIFILPRIVLDNWY